MTKYSTEATSNDDKTMIDLSNTQNVVKLGSIGVTTPPTGGNFKEALGVIPTTVTGKMDMTMRNAKGESRIVNMQDYDQYDLELKNERTILPFQIYTRNNMVVYNGTYMPLPIENGTPVIGNYGLSVPGPQTTTKKLAASLAPKTPAEALQLCANFCTASNKLKFPQFESNCVGFEFNPNTNSCYGFAPGSVIQNKPRKGKKYYMGEINTKHDTLSYYSKQFILKKAKDPVSSVSDEIKTFI